MILANNSTTALSLYSLSLKANSLKLDLLLHHRLCSAWLQLILLPAVVCVRLTCSSVPQTAALFHMCLFS